MKNASIAFFICGCVQLAACSHAGGPPVVPSAQMISNGIQVRQRQAAGPSFKVVDNSADGTKPQMQLTAYKGVLYGTTFTGGSNDVGTVFGVTPSGTETMLHTFGSGNDGALPQGQLLVRDGVLYGTTWGGGTSQNGTVYSVTPSGSENVVYSFGAAPDGAYPSGNLAAIDGTLYGTTQNGGAGKEGTVFSLTTGGSAKVVYSFTGSLNAFYPFLSGVMAFDDTLYGMTANGGSDNVGGVYRLSTDGKEKLLCSFLGGSDGAAPEGNLVNVKGTLYGMTVDGGPVWPGDGTVLRITPAGTHKQLHFFGSGKDGLHPQPGSLTYLNGVLYGATQKGGQYGNGTIFSVTLTGTEHVIYSFELRGPRPSDPSNLVAMNGVL